MGLHEVLDAVSGKAPFIIGAALIAAVAGAWLSAPPWPFIVLGTILFLLAAALWVRRGFARQFKSPQQLGFARIRDWLRFEIFVEGTPRGYYLLGFLSWLSFALTGLRFPYAAVAIAGMTLTVAWGEDRRRYPSEPRL